MDRFSEALAEAGGSGWWQGPARGGVRRLAPAPERRRAPRRAPLCVAFLRPGKQLPCLPLPPPQVNAKYTYMERPRGSPAQQVRAPAGALPQPWPGCSAAVPRAPPLPTGTRACPEHPLIDKPAPYLPLLPSPAPPQADVAVDAVARLVAGLKDGQPLPAEDAQLFEDCVAGGWLGVLRGGCEAVGGGSGSVGGCRAEGVRRPTSVRQARLRPQRPPASPTPC